MGGGGQLMITTAKKIFYDFEVFKYDWLVVFIDFDTRERQVIVNSRSELQDFYNQHKDDIFCGYNSRTYDQVIFKAILKGLHPWTVNSQIINENKKEHQILGYKNKIDFNNFDCLLLNKSLKQLEGFLNSKIKESDIDFNIDRHLTQDEIDETIKYCTHDVEQTIVVFEHTKEEFDAQLSLIEAFDLPMSSFGKTKAQLVAEILGANRYQNPKHDEFDIVIPDTLLVSKKYQHIVDWYKNPKNYNYSRKLYTEVAGCPHVFGYGGIHGALPSCAVEGTILACDVASLYPSIIIEYGLMSRGVSNVNTYKEIRDKRIELKKVKDPRQLPMKIVLNSCYGTFKDEFNPLYDPRQSNNVCVHGQLLILDLIEKLEPYVTILQSNTDGIFMLLHDGVEADTVKSIGAEWEKRTRLVLEWDEYKKLVQKDVNNFIMIAADGSYKSKGAYLKKLSPIDSDLLISNKALIGYFVNDTPIEDTVRASTKLSDFQKIVKITSLYSYALFGEQRLKESVLRVFASNDPDAPGVFKVKLVDGVERIEKIANTPEHCFICGEDINDVPVPANLDLQYYIDLIQERLNDFYSGERKAKIKPKSEIKGINEETFNKLLDLELNDYSTFTDYLVFIRDNSICNKTVIRIMIELGMLNKFGKAKKLLKVWSAFFDEIKYSPSQSDKTKIAKLSMILSVESDAEDDDYSEQEKALFRIKYTGTCVTNDDSDRWLVYVQSLRPACRNKDNKQFGMNIDYISIGTGKKGRATIFTKSFIPGTKEGSVLKTKPSWWSRSGKYFNLDRYELLE
jgi:hypothetical protein